MTGRRTAALLLGILLVVLAGCGGDEEGSDATPSTEPGSATTQAEAPGTVTTSPAASATTVTGGATTEAGFRSEVYYRTGWGAAEGQFGLELPQESAGMGPESLALWENRVYVPDPVNSRVQRLTPDGDVDLVIPLEGPDFWEVAAADDGTLVVYSQGADQLWAFSRDGGELGSLPLQSAGTGTTGYFILESAGPTIYIEAVEEGETPSFDWVPIYREGALQTPNPAFQDPPVARPLAGGYFLQGDELFEGEPDDADAQPVVDLAAATGLRELIIEGPTWDVVQPLADGGFLASASGPSTASEDRWVRGIWLLDEAGAVQARSVVDPAPIATFGGTPGGVAASPDGSLYVLETTPEELLIRRYVPE